MPRYTVTLRMPVYHWAEVVVEADSVLEAECAVLDDLEWSQGDAAHMLWHAYDADYADIEIDTVTPLEDGEEEMTA